MKLQVHFTLLVAAGLLVANRASAESAPSPEPEVTLTTPVPTPPEQGGWERTVNGHSFISPSLLASGMTGSWVLFAQGAGRISFDSQGLDGSPKTSNLFAYAQMLRAQVGIANRFAIELRAEGAAAVAGDLEDIVALGALANLTAGAMPKVRVLTLDDVGLQVSAGVGAFYTRSIRIVPAAFLGVAPEQASSQQSAIQQSSQFQISPTLMVAEGVGPFGLQASVGTAIGVQGKEEDKTKSLELGFQAAFDFDKAVSVPIAVTFEYAPSFDLTASTTLHNIGGGVYYSGRRDFELGLQTAVMKAEGILGISGQMAMQYHF